MTSPPGPPDPLVRRYRPDHLAAFRPDELERYVDTRDLARVHGDSAAWRRVARSLAWELLYRVEPELYERLTAGERLHPRLLARLPTDAERAVEVAAGMGRLTMDLAPRCGRLVAVEPAAPMRERLIRRVREHGFEHVEVREGFFDAVPVSDGWADLVVTCSAFTPDPAHGGEPGLAELERVAAPGAFVALLWPSNPSWLEERGYRYESFDGPMAIEFASPEEAVELARIFYPHAADEIARRGDRFVDYEVLGMNAPRDVCWKRMPSGWGVPLTPRFVPLGGRVMPEDSGRYIRSDPPYPPCG